MVNRSLQRFTSVWLAVILASVSLFALPVPKAQAADEFDTLREKYKVMLNGGTTYPLSDPDIAARVDAITVTAQGYWNAMLKDPTRNRLWNDAPFGSDSTSITTTYRHLYDMALAYTTYGSSLKGNAALKADIISGLDWMNANQFYSGCTQYQNWWHWQIGGPMALNDIVTLMFADLTPTQIANYMAAIYYTQPSVTMTGANRLWESQVIAISGILNKDSARIAAGRDGVSALLPYVTKGDGFYNDGSFVQHNYYAYNGGYGSELLAGIADLMYILNGSTWQITDPNRNAVYQWIYDSYEPLIYRGNLMDMVRGREISRHGLQDDQAAVPVMASIIRLSQIAASGDSTAFKRMVKYWLQQDADLTFLRAVPVEMIIAAKEILANSSLPPRAELVKYKQFAGMDRALQLRPGYGFGISMFSSRIGNFESINAENNKGWHTGDGMTYLYNNDLSQFNDNYWATVDSYRLPGTTVLSNTTQAGNSRSDQSWAGGTDILGQYGVTGMELHTVGKSLTAKKSWFMFDDEIVALGAGITSTDGVAAETVVENRKLAGSGNQALTVNGTAKSTALGWSETMTGTSYVHLSGSVPGSDIGYYFPGGAAIKGLREARTGNWSAINSSAAWKNATLHTRNYLTLWMDHGINPTNGTYAYVLLPDKTSAAVGSYAASPNISILENSASAQAVRENQLNMTGINFWNDAPTTVGLVTSDKKASVMTRETAADFEISVSDPTQRNVGTIYIEINKSATGLIAKDSEVTVIQYNPTMKFKVNVNKSIGKSYKIKFNLAGTPANNPSPIPLPDLYEAEGLPVNALTDSLTVSNDANASGGKKLGFNHNAADDYTEFSLDVTQPGLYAVNARVMKATNGGVYQLSVNGTDVGTAQDMYWNTSELYKDVNMGTYHFTAPGSYLFRLKTVGKHASSSGYKMMLDYLRLTSANASGAETAPF
ncbi:polysaccharide lyase family 8 super-sandwich domain-containing protein [Paenibacillus xanthanilyticus]|uniref:Polysaccharide lyase family 8 super-sandwich domain-containing protein n=1 Tax=Paenibacillus xanthanilyticus TaxID=1783531 RepID=A0ABV8KBI3_9BACL